MNDISQDRERPEPGYTQDDWDEVSDNPEMTDAELAELQPASTVTEVFRLLPKRGRGRPKRVDAKVNLTMRIDPALLEAYRATGVGWQVRMHEALANGITQFDAASTIRNQTASRVRSAASREAPHRVTGKGVGEPTIPKTQRQPKAQA